MPTLQELKLAHAQLELLRQVYANAIERPDAPLMEAVMHMNSLVVNLRAEVHIREGEIDDLRDLLKNIIDNYDEDPGATYDEHEGIQGDYYPPLDKAIEQARKYEKLLELVDESSKRSDIRK